MRNVTLRNRLSAIHVLRPSMFRVWIFLAAVACPALLSASEADALAISQVIQARHLPYGTVMDPVYDSATGNTIVDYTRCGDSAIWTGHYLAAEAFRYNVTNDPDALANAQSAIAGIQSLVDVTGTNLLARCKFPASSPYAASIKGEENHNGIYSNDATGDSWVGNTSRDQYSGVFFGLAVAYDMVSDAPTRANISALVTQMLDFLRNHAWTVVMPDGTISTTFISRADQQLSFMNVGLHVNPSHYANASELSSFALAVTVPAPIAVEVTDNSSYFKFNLDAINLYDLVRLDNSPYHSFYTAAYALLWNHVSSQQNAFFNMIDRALKSSDAARDSQTASMLNQWLERPKRDFYVNLVGTLPSCGSPDEACNPVLVAERPTTDFLWQRDPYLLDGGGQGTIESAGIDYILPFWMARYYGLLTSASVVNAAASGTTVAAESIASFYGSELAPNTGVQVVDGAGASRAATVFYSSLTQLNFEIPAGTVVGQCVINVMNGTQTVATTTAMVASVAPGVFVAENDVAGSEDYLILYGTGIRGRSALSNVTATINGASAQVLYAGSQGSYLGLDQVNIQVPQASRGTSGAEVVVTVDGVAANAATVNVVP